MLIRFLMVMTPLVLLINGISKGDWLESLLFAVSVAVGLTPEMLPMIVTTNLAKGAVMMARRKTIVKRLNAIQNFGAMDILCTDKTGTLTQNKVILERHLDIHGHDDLRVLEYAWLNSFSQTGLKNLLDVAVLEYALQYGLVEKLKHFRKVDEIPFDFVRRRMSIVVRNGNNQNLLVCKGAIEEFSQVPQTFQELIAQHPPVRGSGADWMKAGKITCRHSARKQKSDFVTVRERMPLHENLAIAHGTTLVLNLDHLKRIRVATVPSAICATCRHSARKPKSDFVTVRERMLLHERYSRKVGHKRPQKQ
jgi:magnesium-transporting ATPase (P-type)